MQLGNEWFGQPSFDTLQAKVRSQALFLNPTGRHRASAIWRRNGKTFTPASVSIPLISSPYGGNIADRVRLRRSFKIPATFAHSPSAIAASSRMPLNHRIVDFARFVVALLARAKAANRGSEFLNQRLCEHAQSLGILLTNGPQTSTKQRIVYFAAEKTPGAKTSPAELQKSLIRKYQNASSERMRCSAAALPPRTEELPPPIN